MTNSDVTPDRAELQPVYRAELRHGLPRVRDAALVIDVGLLQPGIAVLRGEWAMWGATT